MTGRTAARKLIPNRRAERRGAAIVEMAFVVPVFAIFMFGIIEVNRAFMVKAVLRSAAEQGARYGVADGVTTAEVSAKVREILGSALPVDEITIYVKDGAEFDDPGLDPATVDYTALPDIEVASCQPRHLYIVRCEVDFAAVSLLPPKFLNNSAGESLLLVGQSVMRHE